MQTKNKTLLKIADVMRDDGVDVVSKTIVIENILILEGYLPRDFNKEIIK